MLPIGLGDSMQVPDLVDKVKDSIQPQPMYRHATWGPGPASWLPDAPGLWTCLMNGLSDPDPGVDPNTGNGTLSPEALKIKSWKA